MEHTLYLGSKSQARHQLLTDAKIPFVLVSQDADESKCDCGGSLRETVERIALYKMEHVMLPEGKEGAICYVLTADTLGKHLDETIRGKPKDRFDAIAMIKAARVGATVGTSFCLDKRECRAGKWECCKRIQQYVEAQYVFDVPDEWIDVYLEKSFGVNASGAIAVEGYGEQFLKSVNGSYSTIVGLPMFELREALQKLGFFKL